MNCMRCGEHHENFGRRFCDGCMPRCACGQPTAAKRSTCLECFERGHRESMAKARSKPCEVCGAAIEGPPSSVAMRRTCAADACMAAFRARRRKPAPPSRMCVECGQPSGTKKTCSRDCLAKMLTARTTIGARSESVRAKRRRHARNAYRGKDKAQVVERLTTEQRGRCKVCGGHGRPLGNGQNGLVLDHCHRTGKPRAMLCGPCNAALGLLGESPERIRALLRYAEGWAQVNVGAESVNMGLHPSSRAKKRPPLARSASISSVQMNTLDAKEA